MAKKDLKITDKCKNPSCMWCQNKIDFELPEHLVDDFLKGDVVIFAGSGISTESKYILPETLYESIAYDLGYKKCHKLFSELMEEYCSRPNGRIKLLSEIKARFDNIKSFPELYRDATRFHRELATTPQLKTIITTNWDTFFEDKCGALPFINPEDFAFWNTSERKIFKIHGSINNFGSIIATKKDYAKCLKNLYKGIAGGILKSVLATKTIVFVGYSFSDEDFQQIYSFVGKEMKGLARQAYIVTLDKENLDELKGYNLIPIVTDGTYFISVLKGRSVHEKRTLPDFLYEYADLMLELASVAHEQLYKKYNCVKNPEIVYCAFYQDGVIHAYERILSLRKKGRYSCPCEFLNTFDIYIKRVAEYRHTKRYGDVAYIEGYLHAHMQLLEFINDPDIAQKLPLFYAYGGGDIFTFKEYNKIFKQIPSFHKTAYNFAKHLVKKSNKGGDFVMHHPAHL